MADAKASRKDRYLTTREAAAVLRVGTRRAWRILRDAKVEPLGKPCREDDGRGMECVWRGVDVRRIQRDRHRTTAIARMVRANILAGIARRRTKREAVCQG